MLYLLLAVLSSAMVSIIMRLSGDRVKNNLSMLAVNYLICTLVAAFDAGWRLIPAGAGAQMTLAMGFIHGACYLLSFWLLQRNVKHNGVVLSSIFMKLGLLVPMAVSLLVFHERPALLQAAGFAFALIAILMVNSSGERDSVGSHWGLLLLLLAGGAGDALAKIFEELGNQSQSGQFLLFTFLTALGLCLLLVWKNKQRFGWNELLFGALIGVPNFLSARFLLGALGELPAVIVYPTCSVGTILVVTLAGITLFREKLTAKQWIAMMIIVVSLIFLIM